MREVAHTIDQALRRAVLFVAVANLAYFGVEIGVALSIKSVALFADSIDFLEDASINLLILLALGLPAPTRALAGMVMAGLILVPGLATLWTAWEKVSAPTPPEPWLLSATGLGALFVNLLCAFVLARFRHHSGSLTKAAFLSARNDALANVGIIGVGLATFALHSAWPDVVVGLAIAAINAGAAKEVWEAARQERATAQRP
jgi:Co/Zn/Cd efflux system component